VAGGYGNTAGAGTEPGFGPGFGATVSGGAENTASGSLSIVAGGAENTASGVASTVSGGWRDIASGDYSFAAGQYANASDFASFVWCQQSTNTCNSMGENSFVVSVDGPIYFYDGPSNQGCYLSTGAGSWTCSSDRNLKDHIQTINPQSVLETLAQMPISQWSMKSDTKSHKHIGPMAQDFYAAFGLGETDKYIAQGDAQGVALASIQGLYQELKTTKSELQQVIQQRNQEIQSLKDRLQALEKFLTNK
jgi:hypothetical protein